MSYTSPHAKHFVSCTRARGIVEKQQREDNAPALMHNKQILSENLISARAADACRWNDILIYQMSCQEMNMVKR